MPSGIARYHCHLHMPTCRWIYDGDFSKVKGSFKCPVCTSPKSRFKVYKGAISGKVQNTGSALAQRKKAKKW